MHLDIRGRAAIESWLVIGWFTEDYTPLARQLSDNLNQLSIPHHLYARVLAPGGWLKNTLQKPQVVLDALAEHTGKTLILFDVDMQVRGDISSLIALNGDVVAPSGTKGARRLPWQKPRRRLGFGSRVMVWKNNPAAVGLAKLWLRECQGAAGRIGDETAFAEAYAQSEGVAVSRLPALFTGMERRKAPPEALIIHDSEREKRREWYRRPWARFVEPHVRVATASNA